MTRPEIQAAAAPTDIAAALIAIERRLAAIERHLAARAPERRPLPANDVAVLELVLPAIADGLGDLGRIVTVDEILTDLADRHPEKLQVLREALGDQPGKRLGRLFGRSRWHTIAGLRVERGNTERGRAVWRISR